MISRASSRKSSSPWEWRKVRALCHFLTPCSYIALRHSYCSSKSGRRARSKTRRKPARLHIALSGRGVRSDQCFSDRIKFQTNPSRLELAAADAPRDRRLVAIELKAEALLGEFGVPGSHIMPGTTGDAQPDPFNEIGDDDTASGHPSDSMLPHSVVRTLFSPSGRRRPRRPGLATIGAGFLPHNRLAGVRQSSTSLIGRISGVGPLLGVKDQRESRPGS